MPLPRRPHSFRLLCEELEPRLAPAYLEVLTSIEILQDFSGVYRTYSLSESDIPVPIDQTITRRGAGDFFSTTWLSETTVKIWDDDAEPPFDPPDRPTVQTFGWTGDRLQSPTPYQIDQLVDAVIRVRIRPAAPGEVGMPVLLNVEAYVYRESYQEDSFNRSIRFSVSRPGVTHPIEIFSSGQSDMQEFPAVVGDEWTFRIENRGTGPAEEEIGYSNGIPITHFVNPEYLQIARLTFELAEAPPPFVVQLAAKDDLPIGAVPNEIWTAEQPKLFYPVADTILGTPTNVTGAQVELVPTFIDLQTLAQLYPTADGVQIGWSLLRVGSAGMVEPGPINEVSTTYTLGEIYEKGFSFGVPAPREIGQFQLGLTFTLLDDAGQELALLELSHRLYLTYDQPLIPIPATIHQAEPERDCAVALDWLEKATVWGATPGVSNPDPEVILAILMGSVYGAGWTYSMIGKGFSPPAGDPLWEYAVQNVDHLLFKSGDKYAECSRYTQAWQRLAQTLGIDARWDVETGANGLGFITKPSVLIGPGGETGNAYLLLDSANPDAGGYFPDRWQWDKHVFGVYAGSGGLTVYDVTYNSSSPVSDAIDGHVLGTLDLDRDGSDDVLVTSSGELHIPIPQRIQYSTMYPVGLVGYSTTFPLLSLPPAGADPTPPAPQSRSFVVGSGPQVRVFNPDGTERLTLTPFPGFGGEVRATQADVSGDGVPDVVVGTGPGGAALKVLDGQTGAELLSILPFDTFTGGIFVAVGDLNGDGVGDLVVTPDEGGGPRVVVLRGGDFAQVASFFGIDDPNFRGGARAAVGDINRDGRADLVVAAGFGGGPRVAVFDGTTVLDRPTRLFNDFFVFEPALRNGAYVAVGDINGDGFCDLIAGAGPGGAPRVLIFSGEGLSAGQGDRAPVLGNFFAGDPENRSGIRVATRELDGDGRTDLLVGPGLGAGSRLTAYSGAEITPSGIPPELLGFDAAPGSTDGIFVG